MSPLNRYRLFLAFTFSFDLLFKGFCYSQDTTKENKSAAIRFANFTDVNIGLSNCISYGVRVSSGIQIKSKLYFGIGAGYDYYRRINNYGGTNQYYKIDQEPTFDLQVMPVYLDIRYPFYCRNELSIYLCLSGGRSILVSDNVNEVDARVGSLNNGGYYTKVFYKYEGGNLYYIGLGFVHKISPSIKLLYGFGYNQAGIVLTDPYNSKQLVGDFIAIRVGIGF